MLRFLLFSLALANLVNAFTFSYYFQARWGERECFYQPVHDENAEVEFEYQVLDSSPINFQIAAPNGVILHTDEHMAKNIVKLKLTLPGSYEICFLNRWSTATKGVYLGLNSDAYDHLWPFDNIHIDNSTETFMDVAVVELRKYMESILVSVDKMRHMQTSIASTGIKDYMVQRANFDRVNLFSVMYIIIVVGASLAQVFTIRKLFGANSTQMRKNMNAST